MEYKADVSRESTQRTGKFNRDPYLFIVGCARSGTTLMHRMVDAHPLIAITPEMHWITHHFKEPNRPTPEGVVTPELVSALTEHKRFAQFEIDREDFEGLLGSGELVTYSRFLAGIFDLYGRARSKPLVGNKTPAYVRRIPELHAMWPEAKFVHLIRDGRDVCLSIMNWKKADRTAGRFSTWDEDPVSTTALWWERKVRTGWEAGSSLEPGLYFEVRYEALGEDPQRECEALCDFLGVPYDDAMLRFHEGKTRVEPGRDPRRNAKKAWLPVTSGLRDWRSEMTFEDVERFEAVAGDLLSGLGYERTVPRPSAGALEHASRIRESFTREVRERGDSLPERW